MANNPPTMAVTLADIQRRLRRLENSLVLSVSDYRVYELAGDLVAEHMPSGTVTVIAAGPP